MQACLLSQLCQRKRSQVYQMFRDCDPCWKSWPGITLQMLNQQLWKNLPQSTRSWSSLSTSSHEKTKIKIGTINVSGEFISVKIVFNPHRFLPIPSTETLNHKMSGYGIKKWVLRPQFDPIITSERYEREFVKAEDSAKNSARLELFLGIEFFQLRSLQNESSN